MITSLLEARRSTSGKKSCNPLSLSNWVLFSNPNWHDLALLIYSSLSLRFGEFTAWHMIHTWKFTKYSQYENYIKEIRGAIAKWDKFPRKPRDLMYFFVFCRKDEVCTPMVCWHNGYQGSKHFSSSVAVFRKNPLEKMIQCTEYLVDCHRFQNFQCRCFLHQVDGFQFLLLIVFGAEFENISLPADGISLIRDENLAI